MFVLYLNEGALAFNLRTNQSFGCRQFALEISKISEIYIIYGSKVICKIMQFIEKSLRAEQQQDG